MLGKPVTDFSLPSTGGTIRLKDERDKLVLCFYPKDNTPGCMQQGSDFRDPLKSHERSRYGRKVRGIERSTFVMDEERRWCANGAG